MLLQFISFVAVLLLLVIIVLLYKNRLLHKKCKTLESAKKQEIQETQVKMRKEQYQNKLVSMNEMMENIAHQWCQPLSQINSAVLVIDDVLYQKEFRDIVIEEKLLEIESLTKFMSKTIDDFKDFFDQTKDKEHFTLQSVVEKSIYIVRGTLKSYDIAVLVEVDKDIRCYGYPSALQQVIVVILNNAKDIFLSRKTLKPLIRIDAHKKGGMIELNICDNGGGIEMEYKEKIFEPYFTTKHKTQGKGLGLYISKLIMEESLDGKLEVTNTKEGACFHLILGGKYERY